MDEEFDEIEDVGLGLQDEYTLNDELSVSNDEIITELLRSRGIEDPSKINFENDEGELEEHSWEDLDANTKFNILNNTESTPELDDSEVQLLNILRSNGLTPEEYLRYVQLDAIRQYTANQQNVNPYKVDDLSDDELYIADLISRTNATEQEAMDALNAAKNNESLFEKQINSLRTNYKKQEDEIIQVDLMQRQEQAQMEYNNFANSVGLEISNFTDFAGYDLNMEDDDMLELFEFITGYDAAGNSHLGKALNDPQTLVKMAWFALNGEQMILDIDNYYKKEITNVRKKSYNDGLMAAHNKPQIIHKNVSSSSRNYDELDDFA